MTTPTFHNCEGKPYRPSNGTEGEFFMDQWCYNCQKDNDPPGPYCLIIAASMAYDLEDEQYPKEWIFDGEGGPMCTAFEARGD